MNESLKAFLSKASEDDELRGRLGEAAGQDSEAVAAIAREAGFDVRAEDVEELRREGGEEIDERELAQVAGGGATGSGTTPSSREICSCGFGGSGRISPEYQWGCDCEISGSGHGDQFFYQASGTYEDKVECSCWFFGSGAYTRTADCS